MYKHCTESKYVTRNEIPEFSVWIEFWRTAVNKYISRWVEARHYIERKNKTQRFAMVGNIYNCYIPVNLQATRLGILHLEDGISSVQKRMGVDLSHVGITDKYHLSFLYISVRNRLKKHPQHMPLS